MPPRISLDGQFWWNGMQWVPIATLPAASGAPTPSPPTAPRHGIPPAPPTPQQPWQLPSGRPATQPGPPPGEQQQWTPRAPLAPSSPPQTQWQPMAPPPGSGRPAGGRWQRGLMLTRMSWQLLAEDRELLLLPVLALIGLAVMIVIILAIGLGIHAYDTSRFSATGYILVALAYVLGSFIAYFFNAALVGAVLMRLRGRRPSLGAGLEIAWQHVGAILAWAVVAATVGQIIRMIQQRLGLLGAIGGTLLGIAWSVSTSFVVPILVVENVGPIQAVERSGQLLKQRWGESFVGSGAIGLVITLIALPAYVVALLFFAIAPALAITLLLLITGVVVTVGTAISGIFRACLYQYAVTGQGIGDMRAEVLHAAFQPKGRRGFFRHS